MHIEDPPAGSPGHWTTVLKWVLAAVLPVAFALAAWQLDRASIGVTGDAYRSVSTVSANALPGLLAWLAIFIATRRLVLSFLVGLAIQALVYTASSIKLEILENPVALEDVYFLTGIDRGGLALFWAYVDDTPMLWAAMGAGALALVLTAWLEKPWFRHFGAGRLGLLSLLLAGAASLWVGTWPWTAFYPSGKTPPLRFTAMPAILHHGLMSSLVHKHLERRTRTFEVDAEALRDAARSLSAVQPPGGMAAGARPVAGLSPDIVVVLSESFFDPRIIKGLDALEDPIPNVRKWIQAGYGGGMSVPTYGGGTIRTEFEILTGMPIQAFPDAGFPYMDLDIRAMPSLPGILSRDAGYRTVAIHGHQGSFYNRANVYKPMGFERFLTAQDFRGKGVRDGQWYSDESMTDILIDELESADEPLFAFAISMENHGPYHVAREVRHMDAWKRISIPDGLSRQTGIEVRNTLYHLSNADAQFARLLDFLQRRGRPYLLLFFGDHLPGLKSTYPELGFVDGRRSRAQQPVWLLIRGHGATTWPASRDICFPWQLPAELLYEAGIDNAYLDFSRTLGAALGPSYATDPDSVAARGLTAAARANLKGRFEAQLP